jgi:hypothetical protein
MDIMTPITRRACLKKAGLSLVGLTVPSWFGLQPSRAAVAESSDTALSPAFDVPAAVSAYQLQTPHRVLQMDVTAGTWLARFTQLANQGYRPIWIQGSTNGGAGVALTIALTSLSAVAVGAYIGRSGGTPAWRSSLRQLVIVVLAAGITFGIGKAIGTTVA